MIATHSFRREQQLFGINITSTSCRVHHKVNSTAGTPQEIANAIHIVRQRDLNAHQAARYRTIGFANRRAISLIISTRAPASGALGSNKKINGLVKTKRTVGQCVSEYALSVIKIASTNPPIVHLPQNVSDPSGISNLLILDVVSFVAFTAVVAFRFINGALPRCASSVSQNVSQNARFFSSNVSPSPPDASRSPIDVSPRFGVPSDASPGASARVVDHFRPRAVHACLVSTTPRDFPSFVVVVWPRRFARYDWTHRVGMNPAVIIPRRRRRRRRRRPTDGRTDRASSSDAIDFFHTNFIHSLSTVQNSKNGMGLAKTKNKMRFVISVPLRTVNRVTHRRRSWTTRRHHDVVDADDGDGVRTDACRRPRGV